MSFCFITMNVNNMEESLKFYHELLGIKVLERLNVRNEIEIAMIGERNKPKMEVNM